MGSESRLLEKRARIRRPTFPLTLFSRFLQMEDRAKGNFLTQPVLFQGEAAWGSSIAVENRGLYRVFISRI